MGDGRDEQLMGNGGQSCCCWLMSHKRRARASCQFGAGSGSAANVGKSPANAKTLVRHTHWPWYYVQSPVGKMVLPRVRKKFPGCGPAVAALTHHTREKSPGLLSNSHIASKDGSFPDNDHLNQPKCLSAPRRSESPARYVTLHLQKECVAARWLIFGLQK